MLDPDNNQNFCLLHMSAHYAIVFLRKLSSLIQQLSLNELKTMVLFKCSLKNAQPMDVYPFHSHFPPQFEVHILKNDTHVLERMANTVCLFSTGSCHKYLRGLLGYSMDLPMC